MILETEPNRGKKRRFAGWVRHFTKLNRQNSAPSRGMLFAPVDALDLVPSYQPEDLEEGASGAAKEYPTAVAAIQAFRSQRRHDWAESESESVSPYEYPIY